MTELKEVKIYTDGASLGNPGPGGYGVVLIHGNHRKELSGGFRLTTNSRMELMAAIIGLQALKTKCKVTIYSDSKYLVESFMEGWVYRWRAKGWKKAKNPDLWKKILELCDQHEVRFEWVHGHAGNPENERCDFLSVQAAQQKNLPADVTYEKQMKSSASNLFE
ncbi:MAG: ribonuclease HI [candidate division KSB1 bacterium]|nr:ribonuclease HI [candidate division KSB1 bacterium]MDZ7302978.1 ribonuclease HI [candidate division KSB1 bacterium]MDZ7312254.1 ribonuclease HI [candidate division KSB1 bacterium]